MDRLPSQTTEERGYLKQGETETTVGPAADQ